MLSVLMQIFKSLNQTMCEKNLLQNYQILSGNQLSASCIRYYLYFPKGSVIV